MVFKSIVSPSQYAPVLDAVADPVLATITVVVEVDEQEPVVTVTV